MFLRVRRRDPNCLFFSKDGGPAAHKLRSRQKRARPCITFRCHAIVDTGTSLLGVPQTVRHVGRGKRASFELKGVRGNMYLQPSFN